jgi:hypothetical protein
VIFLQIDRYSLLAVKGCSPQECWSRKNQSPLRKRVAVLAVMVVLECSNLQQRWSEQILLRRSDWTRIWRIRLRGFVPSLLFPQMISLFLFLGFTSPKMLRTSSRKAIPFRILISTTKTNHWKKKF